MPWWVLRSNNLDETEAHRLVVRDDAMMSPRNTTSSPGATVAHKCKCKKLGI